MMRNSFGVTNILLGAYKVQFSNKELLPSPEWHFKSPSTNNKKEIIYTQHYIYHIIFQQTKHTALHSNHHSLLPQLTWVDVDEQQHGDDEEGAECVGEEVQRLGDRAHGQRGLVSE